MKKYLVTGGMGFVGSHLVEELLARGNEVWALDLFESPIADRLREYENFHLVVDTIKDRELLQKLVDRVDVVCHLAAIASPEEYVRHPRKVMDISLLAALDLIEMCRLSGKLFFFTSTSEIYGRNTALPFSEDDDRVLGSTDVRRWCYSSSKAAVEHYLKACEAEGQLDYVIVRLFNIYGPRLRGRVVDRYVDSVISGDPLIIHGDGTQTRCFTWINDAIDAFITLMETKSAHNDTYNVGNPVETSIADLAQHVLAAAGNDDDRIEHIPHAQAIGESYEDIQRRVPDISRIKEAIGWEPTTPLEDGLQSMIAYRREELALDKARAGGILAATGELEIVKV